MAPGAVELDERGFVLTGRELDDSALDDDDWQARSREPFLLETSMPGVFAAGGAAARSSGAPPRWGGPAMVPKLVCTWPMPACKERGFRSSPRRNKVTSTFR